MAKVYHSINPTFGLTKQEFNLANYKLVAEVDSDYLEDIFELTNHITHDWTRNEKVKPIKGPHRSTSVGDVVELDGKIFLM